MLTKIIALLSPALSIFVQSATAYTCNKHCYFSVANLHTDEEADPRSGYNLPGLLCRDAAFVMLKGAYGDYSCDQSGPVYSETSYQNGRLQKGLINATIDIKLPNDNTWVTIPYFYNDKFPAAHAGDHPNAHYYIECAC